MGEAGLELLYHPTGSANPCGAKGKRGILLGVHLLGRSSRPDIPRLQRVVEE